MAKKNLILGCVFIVFPISMLIFNIDRIIPLAYVLLKDQEVKMYLLEITQILFYFGFGSISILFGFNQLKVIEGKRISKVMNILMVIVIMTFIITELPVYKCYARVGHSVWNVGNHFH